MSLEDIFLELTTRQPVQTAEIEKKPVKSVKRSKARA
jgi:hypothetical protein